MLAGTNGKGSTIATLSQLLRQAGFTGWSLYLSLSDPLQ